MSHGVHEVQHQVEHELEHEEHDHGGGGHAAAKPPERNNKRIALLIAVIALFLAFSETLGKSAQTAGLSYNVEASNLWAFYQAKTIRQTTLQASAELLKLDRAKLAAEGPTEAFKTALNRRIETWEATVARYESEPREREVRKEVNLNPPYGEGRRELAALAVAAERKRDTAMERYHNYEIGSAAYQIGIVLASAAVLTGIVLLAYAAAGLGIVGLIFTGFGLFAPTIPHDVLHWVEHFFVASGAH